MPSAPPAIFTPPSPSPATPAVIHAPPVVGAADDSVITYSGEDLTDGVFPLAFTDLHKEEALWNGKSRWSADSDGISVQWDDAEFNPRWVFDYYGVYYWSAVDTENPYDPEASFEPALGSDGTGYPVFSAATSGLAVPPSIHTAPSATPGNPPVITP